MKTPRRNKAAAVLFFVLVGLVGGAFGTVWLSNSAFNLNSSGVFFVSMLWGAMIGAFSVWMYHELEDLAWHRRARADERRLEEIWAWTKDKS